MFGRKELSVKPLYREFLDEFIRCADLVGPKNFIRPKAEFSPGKETFVGIAQCELMGAYSLFIVAKRGFKKHNRLYRKWYKRNVADCPTKRLSVRKKRRIEEHIALEAIVHKLEDDFKFAAKLSFPSLLWQADPQLEVRKGRMLVETTGKMSQTETED